MGTGNLSSLSKEEESWDGHLSIHLKGMGIDTSPFYLKGDGTCTSPVSLKSKDDGMATTPFYLKWNGDGLDTFYSL